VEYLCDVAASEFLFPEPFFHDDISGIVGTSEEIVGLAQKYEASPDATLRRFVECRQDPQAVIFFRWKLKPTERRHIDTKGQRYLIDCKKPVQPERRLRVEYSILNDAFDRLGQHIPLDKSVEDSSVICLAAADGMCMDATEQLDLGPLHGRFHVRVIPLFTSDADLGPSEQKSVAALIGPAPRPARRKVPRPR